MMINKKWLAIALMLLVLGYFLMAISNVDFLQLTVSPLLIIAGYSATVVAILKNRHEVNV